MLGPDKFPVASVRCPASRGDFSPAGWVALVLGVVVTLALGIGLMSLVFISSRRGFDEPGGDGR